MEGTRQVAGPPDTGSLRRDLLHLGRLFCRHGHRHSSTIRAVLGEVSHNPPLSDAMQKQFLDERKALIRDVLSQAVDRGEIDASAINDELWDLMPGYLIFRSIVSSQPPTENTVRVFVDNFIIPSLTRQTE